MQSMVRAMVLLLVLLMAPLAAAEHYSYRISTGTDAVVSDITVNAEGQRKRVINRSGNELTELLLDSDGNTLEWHYSQTDLDKDIFGVRQDDRVQLKIRDGDKSYEKTVKLEGHTWYQNIDLGARGFLLSDEKVRSFRILNPSDLGVVKLKLEKKELKTMEMGGRSRAVLRVEMHSDNFFLYGLWKADYWFDADTALYLRYEGANGGPGTPKTHVELLPAP